MRPFILYVITGIAAVTTTALAFTQQDEHDRPSRAVGHESMSTSSADRILASWVLIENEKEVALAELASQRATEERVKEFARMLEEDHRRAIRALEPIAASTAGLDGHPGRLPSDRGMERSAHEAGFGRTVGELDHVALLEELGRECLDTAKEELQKKSGKEFDRCFVNMMVGAHLQMNDMLTVFRRHAGGELADVFARAQEAVGTHLERAKQLSEDFEGGATTSLGEGR